MDYGTFKALLGMLLFGSVFSFGLKQLASLRRARVNASQQGPADRPRSGSRFGRGDP